MFERPEALVIHERPDKRSGAAIERQWTARLPLPRATSDTFQRDRHAARIDAGAKDHGWSLANTATPARPAWGGREVAPTHLRSDLALQFDHATAKRRILAERRDLDWSRSALGRMHRGRRTIVLACRWGLVRARAGHHGEQKREDESHGNPSTLTGHDCGDAKDVGAVDGDTTSDGELRGASVRPVVRR